LAAARPASRPLRERPKTIVQLIDDYVENGERAFAYWQDELLTACELGDAANRIANGLRGLGVDHGDPVSVMSPNGPDFYKAWFGILKAGAVFNPVNAQFTPEEAAYVVRHVGARVLIAHESLAASTKRICDLAPAVEHVVFIGESTSPTLGELAVKASPESPEADVAPEDVAAVVYTSGTTGRPKGAVLTHGNFAWDVAAACDVLPVLPDDILGLVLPLFHVNAQLTSLVQLAIGGTLEVFSRFSPSDLWPAVERHGLTTFSAVPTMLAMLLAQRERAQHDLSSLRYVICGASPLSETLAGRFESAFGLRILQGYGLTEGTCVSSLDSYYLPRRIGSIGLPLRGQIMRIADSELRDVAVGEVGEILVQGPNVMRGYFHDDEATEAAIVDGWLRTGDAGTVDRDGYFWIVDRLKDMIIRGGENIYPREIEEVLFACPGVIEAAVLGVPDPLWGEEVRAVLVAEPGSSLDEEQVRRLCGDRLAAYKVPKFVEIRDTALPKTATGKVDKRSLVEEGAGGEVAERGET
jgi:long-chain acyl-CoA synthetase